MYQSPLDSFTAMIWHYLSFVSGNYDQYLRLVLIDIISKIWKTFWEVLLLSTFLSFNAIYMLIYKGNDIELQRYMIVHDKKRHCIAEGRYCIAK